MHDERFNVLNKIPPISTKYIKVASPDFGKFSPRSNEDDGNAYNKKERKNGSC